jgi:hypothetical protein
MREVLLKAEIEPSTAPVVEATRAPRMHTSTNNLAIIMLVLKKKT